MKKQSRKNLQKVRQKMSVMSNTASQMVMVDITKLGQGLKSVFTGCAMVFDSLGVGGAANLISGVSDTAKNQVEQMAEPQQEVKQEPTEKPAAEKSDEDAPPFDTEPAAPAVTISSDDLLKVASQKITANRKNSAKIKALLTTYGCSAISEIPDAKREAFLNDLAQL